MLIIYQASVNNTAKQMSLLFVCLKTRGLPGLQGFLHVLRLTFHGWIADDIMDAQINRPGFHMAQYPVSVRAVINKALQDELRSDPEYPLEKNIVEITGKTKSYDKTKTRNFEQVDSYGEKGRAVPVHDSRHVDRRHEYHRKRDKSEERRTSRRSDGGHKSPLVKIPKNLWDLQLSFDTESAATRKSLAELKQEEMTIKTLLQQNLREQQEMLVKQETLVNINARIKEINKSAAQLFRPPPAAEVRRERIHILQRVPLDDRNYED